MAHKNNSKIPMLQLFFKKRSKEFEELGFYSIVNSVSRVSTIFCLLLFSFLAFVYSKKGFAQSATISYGAPYNIQHATFSNTTILDVNPPDGAPADIIFNSTGTVLYLLGGLNDIIHSYNLTTPFDISTAGPSTSLVNVVDEENPTTFAFNQTGTILYLTGRNDDVVGAYTLGTPFDLSTVTAVNTNIFDPGASNPSDILFSDDGMDFYMLITSGDFIARFPLTTAFDLSTATAPAASTFSVSSQDNNPQAIIFNNDGTRLYLLGTQRDEIIEYALSTPYLITSASATFSQINEDLSSIDTSPQSFRFNDDGTVIYILGESGDDITQGTIPDGRFVEPSTDDGSLTGSFVITVNVETFAGSNGDDFIADGRASIANVPAGLTPVLTRNSANMLTLTFTGNATNDNPANDVTNLIFNFDNSAFTGNNAAGVSHAVNASSNMSINFITLDSDADGILDTDDLDGDNDGIPDDDECGSSTNLIVNGSFEPADGTSTVTHPPNFLSGGNADITLPGWNIVGDIDLTSIGVLGPAGDAFTTGTQLMDLLGNNPREVTNTAPNQRLDIQPGYVPNGIEQVVPIPAGSFYTLSFDYTSNSVGGGAAAEIFIDGILVDSVSFTGGSNFASQSYSREFVATGTTETIRLIASVAAANNNFGLFIDNVSLIVSCFDTDGDGIVNSLDLDSDNDGVPDIVEAGGVDANNDGIVDGVFADGDGDGFADLFDTDNGGTPLADTDTDADAVPNRIDIDSDGDGIVDIIELQPSGTLISPSGMDSDADGIDDNFDPDSGNSLTTPVNTDGVDMPDYLDIDSDNDGESDLIEAYDTNGDGVTDITPAGADADGDGLDDNFDNEAVTTVVTNVTNNGQNAASFPNVDDPATSERDWRENGDPDNDGIPNNMDSDDDNDGILDDDDCGGLANLIVNGSFEPADGTTAVIPPPNFISGGNADITLPGWNIVGDIDLIPASVAGVAGAAFTTGTQFIDLLGNNPTEATTTAANQRLDAQPGYVPNGIEQVVNLPVGSFYTFSFNYTSNRRNQGVAAEIFIDGVLVDAVVFTGANNFTRQSYSREFISTGTTETIRLIASVAGTDNFGLFIDSVNLVTCFDTDGDGILNSLDLDSDNDGVLDIVEAGGVDANNDGMVDGVFADGDMDGFANLFDTDNGGTPLADTDTDADAIPNRIDIDSDGDGIADVVEAGGADSDGDGMLDVFADTDGDGIADAVDANNAGTALSDPDTDGDSFNDRIDIDADNDGIIDNIEGQPTAAFTAPTGMDTDTDGLDNAYDTDNGGTAIVLSNIDSGNDAIPDYLDQNSDNDTEPDWQEGFDDDLTGDALEDLILRADNYETAAGNPLFYVNADDGNGTDDGDGIPDWLEDNDGDNISNFLDPDSPFYHDDDADGLVNLHDADNDGFSTTTPAALSNMDGDAEPDFRDVGDIITLPIELLDFSAIRVEDNVQLEWTTITEINNDFFTVERSSNGKNFKGILTEPGAGNSTEPRSYRRFDNSPLQGLNYYRLRQTDYNGDTDTFDIEVVDFELANVLVKLYPNPTTGEELFLELPNNREDSYKIDLIDSEGAIIKTMRREIYEGSPSFRIEILNGTKLASGTYHVVVQGTNFIYTSPVVFQ